jgi:SRSO17 transposase
VGIVSEIKRKTLPAIAEVVGLENSQSLHHFLTELPWKVEAIREQTETPINFEEFAWPKNPANY